MYRIWKTSNFSFHFQHNLLCWRNSAVSFCWEWYVVCFVSKGFPCFCVLSQVRQIHITFPKELCSSWSPHFIALPKEQWLTVFQKKNVSTERHNWDLCKSTGVFFLSHWNITPKMNVCTKFSHFCPLAVNLKLLIAIDNSKWYDTWCWHHIIHVYVKVS